MSEIAQKRQRIENSSEIWIEISLWWWLGGDCG